MPISTAVKQHHQSENISSSQRAHSGMTPSHPTIAQIMQLQKTIGNRAVTQLFRSHMLSDTVPKAKNNTSPPQSVAQLVSYTGEEVKQLHSMLGSKEEVSEFQKRLSVFEEGDVPASDLILLADRTLIGRSELLRNIEKGEHGFVREVLLALSYLKRFSSKTETYIQFDVASQESIASALESVSFTEAAQAVRGAKDPSFDHRDEEYKTPIGADIVVWVKNVSEDTKNSFIQSKNVVGGASDWKKDIPYYVAYAAGQLAGFNQNEFSITNKNFFDGIVYITYNPNTELLQNKSALQDKISNGLNKLHDFEFVELNKGQSAVSEELIKRQQEYTSKVIVEVPLANETYEYDLEKKIVNRGTSDFSKYNIAIPSTQLEHNEVNEEQELLASQTEKEVEMQIGDLDTLSYALFTQCEKVVLNDQFYGEIFREHYFYGIGTFGVAKFIKRFLTEAMLEYVKKYPRTSKSMKQHQMNSHIKDIESLQSLHHEVWEMEDTVPIETETEAEGTTKSSKKKAPKTQKTKKVNPYSEKLGEITELENTMSGTAGPEDFESEYKSVDYQKFCDNAGGLDWKEILTSIGVKIIGLNAEVD